MTDCDLTLPNRECSRQEIGRHLGAYCFEDLSDRDRRLFEAHLLDCDFCWTEVQLLSAAVQAMRFDKELSTHISAIDITAVLGISAKLDWSLGGHLRHAVTASALYASGYAAALFMEVAYAFDRSAMTAWIVGPSMFLWSFATSLLALILDWRVSVVGERRGLPISLGIFTAAAIALCITAYLLLPAVPITRLTVSASTAQAAFFKDLRYLLPLGLVFIAVPFHLIIAMQRELRKGRHRLALGLLCGNKRSVPPQNALYISVRTLWIVLLAACLASIPMTAHLLDNLLPTHYMNLFITLVEIRWALYFGLGLECLAWYSHSLNEAKRECLAVEFTSI